MFSLFFFSFQDFWYLGNVMKFSKFYNIINFILIIQKKYKKKFANLYTYVIFHMFSLFIKQKIS